MSKEKKVVPELRFSGFEEDGEWIVTPFKKAFKRVTRKNVENNQNVLTISAQQGLISQLEYFNKKVSSKDVTGYYLLHRGDFAYNKSYSNGYPMGVIKLLKHYDKGVVSTLYLCFRPKEGYLGNFFEQYFESGIINNEIRKIAQEGGRAHGLLNVGIKDFFSEINLIVPSNTQEQQKIADCLSSLDELITAHNDKLEALKEHKKGLLQNLFPQEGEKVPKSRFPEFENDGEWVEKKLGDAADFINGRAYKKKELLPSGKYRVLRVGNLFTNNEWYYSDLELDEDKYCDKGDLLYAWSASFGPHIWKEEKVIYHYHIWKVIGKKAIDKQFLFVLLDFETENIKATQARGLGMQHLTKSGIESWESTIPPTKKEQQKIATCLLAVDNLISAQHEKIEQLQQHKKGLMQGLFPKIID